LSFQCLRPFGPQTTKQNFVISDTPIADVDTDGKLVLCHPDRDCVQISPDLLRAIVEEELEDEADLPGKRGSGGSYLFRSRR
jgi:hypothetical protein